MLMPLPVIEQQDAWPNTLSLGNQLSVAASASKGSLVGAFLEL
jgi:hypothetical protein